MESSSEKIKNDVVSKELIEEYYKLKLELNRMLKREELVKNIIKKSMYENNIKNINTEKIDLFCKEVERTIYQKFMIEKFVPEEIKDKIRTINKSVILYSKLKK